MRRITSRAAGLIIVAAVLLVTAGCKEKSGPTVPNKIVLFNGTDFTGWKLFVADANVDADKIWTVRDGVVHCEGVPNGYMRTEVEHRDYKLHLEWRWTGEPTNSGVLLHAGGPDKVWPRCIEAQLKAGNAGDFVLIGGTGVTVDGQNRQNVEKQYVVVAKKHDSNEKAAGQWNSYDIVCKGDTIGLSVNGLLQNEAVKATETAGWICLQSEGSPIEFRNIFIEPVD